MADRPLVGHRDYRRGPYKTKPRTFRKPGSLGEAVTQARVFRQLSIRTACLRAEHMDMGTSWHRWETNETKPTAKSIAMVAQVLKVSFICYPDGTWGWTDRMPEVIKPPSLSEHPQECPARRLWEADQVLYVELASHYPNLTVPCRCRDAQ